MGNPQIGLRPIAPAGGGINTRKATVSGSNTIALGVGSAVYMAGGVVLGSLTPAVYDGTEKISGVVVRCIDSNGRSVPNIPASTSGYSVEMTTDPDLRFAIKVSGTGIAAADLGKSYELTDETMTANSNGMDGDSFSKRELDSATEAASGKQLVVQELTGVPGNAYATDGMEVIVTIDAASFVQA